AFGAAGRIVFDALILLQRLKAAAGDGGEMREQIFAAALRADETETFLVVEPLYCADGHVLMLTKILLIKWGEPRLQALKTSRPEEGINQGYILWREPPSQPARAPYAVYRGRSTTIVFRRRLFCLPRRPRFFRTPPRWRTVKGEGTLRRGASRRLLYELAQKWAHVLSDLAALVLQREVACVQ